MTYLPAREWAAMLAEHEGRCAYCGVIGTTDNPICQEHMTPIVRGGSNTRENITPGCRRCNSRKGIRTREEYLAGVKAGGLPDSPPVPERCLGQASPGPGTRDDKEPIAPELQQQLDHALDLIRQGYKEMAAAINAIEDPLEAYFTATALGEVVKVLFAHTSTTRAAFALKLRDDNGWSLGQLAQCLGVTRARADQLIRTALRRPRLEDLDLQATWETAWERQRPVYERGKEVRGQQRAERDYCKHGHLMDEENAYVNPKTGYRTCRECTRRNIQALRVRKAVAAGRSYRAYGPNKARGRRKADP